MLDQRQPAKFHTIQSYFAIRTKTDTILLGWMGADNRYTSNMGFCVPLQ